MENKEEVALKSLLLALIHSRQKSTRTFEIKNNSFRIKAKDLDFNFNLGGLYIYISSSATNTIPKCAYENFLKADTTVLYWNKNAGYVQTKFNNLRPSDIGEINISNDEYSYQFYYIDDSWRVRWTLQRKCTFTFNLTQNEIDQIVNSAARLTVSLRGSWNFLH